MKQVPARPRTALSRVLRAVLLGVLGFALLSLAPALLLRWHGVDPGGDRSDAEQADAAGPADSVPRRPDGRPMNDADRARAEGRAEALAAGITTHAQCRERFADDRQGQQRLACSDLVTERKALPARAPGNDMPPGTTTAQCVAQVNAYYEPHHADQIERGDHRVAAVMQARRWLPALNSCERFDNVRLGSDVHQPMSRLQALVAKLDNGQPLQPDDLTALNRDVVLVAAWPDAAQRAPYFELLDRLLAGQEPPRPDRVRLNLGCEEIAAALQRLQIAEAADVQAQRALRQGDTVRDGARWNALNQARINRLWDWKLFSDAARERRCPAMANPTAMPATPASAAPVPPPVPGTR